MVIEPIARLGLERQGDRLADVARLELAFEHPEDAVRGDEAGEPARFLEGLRALKQAACGAIEGGSEQGQYLPGERRELGEAGLGLRYRSEEHTSELQSLMRISYAAFCLKKKKRRKPSAQHGTTTSTTQ